MSDSLTLAELHDILAKAEADRADPWRHRRTLAFAIERETRKLPHLQAIGPSTMGLESRIEHLREEHRVAVLETAR